MGVLVAVVVAGLACASAGLAATEVPRVTNFHADPARFCAKRTSTCSHPGTHLRFRLSSNARVRIDIRPRSQYLGSFVEYVGRRPAGANSVRLQDSRLTPGRWTVRIQATNNVGSGPIALTDVRVVRRG